MNHLTVQQLSAALDGSLNGPSLELVVHHLAHCHECRDRQARLARHDDVMRRLLAQDPHDLFLDDLERRVEAVLVAIMQGLPVPPMVTSSPLQSEEDPGQPVEPPLPDRPELGRAGALAHEAGFGRIGVKPTASTQAPPADPAEAQRLLESLAGGDARELDDTSAPSTRERLPVDGPLFELPKWIQQGGTPKPAAPKPRELPKVQLQLEQLGEHTAKPAHDAVKGASRRDVPAADPRSAPPSALPAAGSPPSALPAAGSPPECAPAAAESPWPRPPVKTAPPSQVYPAPAPLPAAASPPRAATQPATTPAATPAPGPAAARESAATPPPRTQKPDVVVQETPWRKSSADIPRPVLPPVVVQETAWRKSSAAIPRPVLPPEYRKPVTEAYEQVNEPPRPRTVPRTRRTERFAGAWVLATATVGGLLVLVLALQFLPPADTPGATAWRGFQWSQLQFATGDSTHDAAPKTAGQVMRTATTPVPVDAPVPRDEVPLDAPLADSAGVVPDSLAATPDSLGAAPGRASGEK